jgi:hypothetical protein
MTIDWQMKRKKLDELMSTEKLTDWLGKQDPGGEYVWSDPVKCMMGKYLADHDVEWGVGAYSQLPDYYQIAQEKPWTYGAALERAKTLALPAPALQIEATPIEVRELEYEPGRRESTHQVQPEHVERRQYLGGPDQAGHGQADRPVRTAIEHAGG